MKSLPTIIMIIMLTGSLFSCEEEIVTHVKNVTLKNTELFIFDLGIYGDEEGARIIRQARHYESSVIIRDASTSYNTVYQYKALVEYYGFDEVEIETCSGGEGIRCDNAERLIIKFKIIP